MSRPSERTPAQRLPLPAGFTLLEVLVALVCFALVFGALAQIMRTGLRQSAAAETTIIAGLVARSQLARVGVELPLEPGETEGEVDGMRWRTTIRLTEGGAEDLDISAYRIDVTVAWGPPEDDRAMTLTTLRIGPSP
jgi:general secretion pathway protein I